jgi:hypothetical protein
MVRSGPKVQGASTSLLLMHRVRVPNKCGESEDCRDIDSGPIIDLLTKFLTGYESHPWQEA